MPTQREKLLKKHTNLIQTDNVKVVSHVQREEDDWFLNTVMIEDVDVPFKYKRKQLYRSLNGQRVNLSYYPDEEQVAGFSIEVMKVVRIKVA
ncbi:hypothetical protein [Thalassotalea agarivorans]|uniref:Uncharacterized protein n=1 Tax=Thalassotalea agarivorans TaxID=349064 RepID=A0A1H9ZPH1_THASX|nr:hypothetical protein [Thalassotalea agarivorans]SES83240.1 hypothetical protein SAMN05660429_00528 [Thalassotalea agarivorans]